MVETDTRVVHRWAIALPNHESPRAAALRGVRGVEALVVGDHLWLRGELVTDDERKLRWLIPGEQPFHIGPDGQLTRDGQLVPSARLPNGPWQPLNDCLQLQLPVVRNEIAGRPLPARLTLKRGGDERPATILRTTLEAWAAFVDSAPQWRLDNLAFAVDVRGDVLVRGTPLPPLCGTQWIERDGIATPVGWSWRPVVAPAELNKLFGLAAGDLALLAPAPQAPAADLCAEPMLSVVRVDDWVRATRSGVRSTVARWSASGKQIA